MSKSDPIVVTAGLLRSWPLPDSHGTKNERGRVLVVGGSRETVGAVLLAGEAALRAGAGKLQVATVESRADALSVALPEALVRPLKETRDGHIDPSASDDVADLAGQADAVLLGPGMTGKDDTTDFVGRLVPAVQGRLLLDALALALVGPDAAKLDAGRPPAVLTPNLDELAIMLSLDGSQVAADVVAAAASAAAMTGAVVHGGGELSVTAAPDGRSWRDDHGTHGLGVSGSGDVLAGVVAGLLARGAEPEQAAVWGARLHAEAGNRLAARVGPVGFLAREISVEVARALRHLR
jgi:hydroxyethylthiazole kinase-like uncharacterized protein yjeF